MLQGMTPNDRYGGPCHIVKKAIAELDDSDKKILFDALDNIQFSNLRLSSELTERGFSVSENVIRRHRTGKCACARNAKTAT